MIAGKNWSDWLGVAASIGCAIHCAAMPFVIAFLPMLGLSFLADEGFHQVMVVVCLVLAAMAFIPGWRRHRQMLPTAIAGTGLTLIALSAFALEDQCCSSCTLESAEVAELSLTGVTAPEQCTEACCAHCEAATTPEAPAKEESITSTEANLLGFSILPWITPLGGLLLISAHLTNYRLICRCGCCSAEPTETSSVA